MKKLNLTEMENLQGGGIGDCVDVVIGSVGVLVADPIYFLVLYDPYLTGCLR